MNTTIINANILFVLDIVVLTALAIAMLYVYRLNKQLKHFNESREELKVFLSSFGESLKHTKMGIREIKAIGDNIAIEIAKKLKQAKDTKDELSFFVDRANKSIEELESKIALAKDINQKPNFVRKEPINDSLSSDNTEDKIDQDIINRIQQINEKEKQDINQQSKEDNFSKDAILQKLQNIR